MSSILQSVAASIVTALVLAGANAIKGRTGRHKAMQDGIKCSLRREIITDHAHYMDKGWIPVYAMENVLESYEAYHALGGNGTVSKMVEELKRLPTRKE